jgi:glycine oxidase
VEGAGVVLAAGCWSGKLRGLPRRLPVRPVRGQILRLASDRLPTDPVLADHGGRYLVPLAGGALAGSTMDESGFEAEVTEAGRASIRGAVRGLCPDAGEAAVAEGWAGLRPVSDDGAPIIGPDPELKGLFYATGYGRSGILLSPLLAEFVADLALGREPDIRWRALSIERFDGMAAASTGGE